MRWVLLQTHGPVLSERSVGAQGRATSIMAHKGWNLPPTAVLPVDLYHRIVHGAPSAAAARALLEQVDLAAEQPSLTRILSRLAPDLRAWPSVTLPPVLSSELILPEEERIVHTVDELAGVIRAIWLSLLEDTVLQAAQTCGVSEQQFLDSASVGILLQHCERHSGLTGQTWSASPRTGEPFVRIACKLDTAAAEKTSWAWRLDEAGALLERPSPVPADEIPILQTAQLTQALVPDVGPCRIDWSWDGQELLVQRACPLPVSRRLTVFSRQVTCRIAPNQLMPLPGSLLVDLAQQAYERLSSLFLPRERPAGMAACMIQSSFYLNQTLIRSLADRLGLPLTTVQKLLGPATGPLPAVAPRTTLRHPQLLRAHAAVRLAIPQFEQWVSHNSPRFRYLDDTEFSAWTSQQTLGRLSHLRVLLASLIPDMILLQLLSSQRNRKLRTALEACGAADRLDAILQGTSDTAGLNPWTHLDDMAVMITEESARTAAELLTNAKPGDAMDALCRDVTLERTFDAFFHAFWFFRTAVADISTPTLLERKDLLPALLLRARETGAAQRTAERKEPENCLAGLPQPATRALRRAYADHIQAAAATEKGWYYFARILSSMRLLLLHQADLLVQAGHLAQREDVFFLAWEELSSSVDLQQAVLQRSAAFQDDLQMGAAPLLVVRTTPPAPRGA